MASFTQVWKHYEPFVKAVVELFHPFVEASVHDLEKGKIVALYHTISQRKVGDTSPIEELNVPKEEFPPYFSPYYKKNWDGRPLKCTSITLRNDTGKPVGLICFNTDVSFLSATQKMIETFLKVESTAENPVEIFGGPIDNHITQCVDDYLQQQGLSIDYLTRTHKKELVHHLYHKGMFNFKQAVPHIARMLSSSRASIYNYLKELS